MKLTYLRVALPAALIFGATELSAQTDTTKKVVRDSAAGMLDADVDAKFARLLAALNTLDSNTTRLNAVSGLKAEQITLIDTRTLARGNNQRALDEAVTREETKITTMRSTLQNNMVLRDLLVSKEIPMSQVIAVDVAADGTTATVFYHPKS